MTLADRLARLEHKYQALAALRARRDALEAAGGAFTDEELQQRRRAFHEVAREFPGALRELEVTSAEILTAKVSAVRAAREALPAPPPRWILVVLEFHALLREVLRAKRWLADNLAKDAPLTDEVISAFGDPALLMRVRRPPGGRLLTVVWGELAARHGTDRAALERLVFGPP